MEGITEIDKTEYIDECKEIVRNEITEELSDEMLTIVTNEIMDTCLFIGGDFKKENIIDIERQAEMDGLTGIYNRATTETIIKQKLANPESKNCLLILLVIIRQRFSIN